jgi:hypothetical protein
MGGVKASFSKFQLYGHVANDFATSFKEAEVKRSKRVKECVQSLKSDWLLQTDTVSRLLI